MVGEFVYTHMRMYTCLPYAYCSERMCAKDMCTGWWWSSFYTCICARIRACRMCVVVYVCVRRACVRGDGGRVFSCTHICVETTQGNRMLVVWLFVWMVVCMFVWLVARMVVWLRDWLLWLVAWLDVWSCDWLFGNEIGCLFGYAISYSRCWLCDWMFGCLFVRLVVCLVARLFVWLRNWLLSWLCDWIFGWLCNCLFNWFVGYACDWSFACLVEWLVI